MRALIIYPLPFDAWHEFAPTVKRFADSFREFPPGTLDYELLVTCAWGEPTDRVRELFYGIKTRFVPYYGNGCDIGAHEAAIHSYTELLNTLAVGLSTRAYFHRQGWLVRYLEEREKRGRGLYGIAGSWEGRAHLRTCGYAMDALDWWDYREWSGLETIDTREKTHAFESGPKCITQFFLEQDLPAVEVNWDGARNFPYWRHPDEKEIFRRGNQGAMLMWDKWADHYRDASPEEKAAVSAMTDPPESKPGPKQS